jgi:hypothetical protein
MIYQFGRFKPVGLFPTRARPPPFAYSSLLVLTFLETGVTSSLESCVCLGSLWQAPYTSVMPTTLSARRMRSCFSLHASELWDRVLDRVLDLLVLRRSALAPLGIADMRCAAQRDLVWL